MEKLPKLFASRVDYVKSITTGASGYIEPIKDIVIGLNSNDYFEAQSSIKHLTDQVNLISHIDFDSSTVDQVIRKISDIYDNLTTIEVMVSSLVSVVSNQVYSKMATYSLSANGLMNIQRYRSQITAKYSNYKPIILKIDDEIFEAFMTTIDMDRDSDVIYDFIMATKSINEFTIRLMGILLKIIKGDKRRDIELLVERQKDTVLGSTRLPGWNALVRYGLYPITSSMSILDLCKHMGVKYDISKSVEDNLIDGENNYVVIIKSNPSPIEFDIRSVADLDYIIANKMETKPLEGLNRLIIKKFETAKMLSQPNTLAWKSTVYSKNRDQLHWIVIESINGKLYRQLGYHGSPTIRRNLIAGLIDGVSLRCDRYNSIQAMQITKVCSDEHAKRLTAEYDNMTLASNRTDKLIEELVKGFKKTTSEIVDTRSFQTRVLDRDLITGSLMISLPHITGTFGKKTNEFMLTYLIKIDVISQGLWSEFKKRINRAAINQRDIEENSKEVLIGICIQIYQKIATESVMFADSMGLLADYDMTLKEYYLNKKHLV